MISTVVFDLGGVLIDWNPRHLYRKIFGADEAGMEAFLSEVCNAEWNEWQDAGRSWAEAIETTVARHPAHESSIRAYHARWPEMLAGPIHGTVAILEELRARGIRLLALTNWSTETFPIAQARYEFLEYFEGILVSGHERLAKPDPAIFRLLIQRYAVNLAATVFIDDSPRNVAASNLLGLKALHFTSPAQLRRDLHALGLPLSPGEADGE
jgi:2-haloacid dehalogenase